MRYLRAMPTEPIDASPKRNQTLILRIVWFLVGAVVNYLLIATPLKYLTKNHPELPLPIVTACSIAVSTTFFFCWNYFVNFRTDARKRDAFARYVTAVIVLGIMSWAILTIFKKFDAKLSLSLAGHSIDLDVVATQLCFGWLKFLVYHKWAFPVSKPPVGAR